MVNLFYDVKFVYVAGVCEVFSVDNGITLAFLECFRQNL